MCFYMPIICALKSSHQETTLHLRTIHRFLNSPVLGTEGHFFGDIDGHPAGSPYILNKGIQATPYISTPDGLIVSSQLIVPTTKANNNITVTCTVFDLVINHQSSNPVKAIWMH